MRTCPSIATPNRSGGEPVLERYPPPPCASDRTVTPRATTRICVLRVNMPIQYFRTIGVPVLVTRIDRISALFASLSASRAETLSNFCSSSWREWPIRKGQTCELQTMIDVAPPGTLGKLDFKEIESRLALCPSLPSLGSINKALQEL